MLDLDGSSLTNEEKTLLQNPHVGGVILFSRNIVSKNQVLSLCHQIAEVNPNLLIAVDQEGGRVQRLIDGYAVLPSMQKLGKFIAQDKDNGLILASNLGWLMASEVIASGLDISFAPVLDLDLDRSSIIGDRSFGDTPKTVINIANSFINGMNEAGMEAVGKHFPGHGGIHADTHLSYTEDLRSLDDLKQHDLLPFHELHNRLGGILIAHISFPEIDNRIRNLNISKTLLSYCRLSNGLRTPSRVFWTIGVISGLSLSKSTMSMTISRHFFDFGNIPTLSCPIIFSSFFRFACG